MVREVKEGRKELIKEERKELITEGKKEGKKEKSTYG